ncbi:hypothetical protein [Mesorhizobium sp. M6A.T.Ce.TU.016.01.1.1]|uniref:hypothetical protein n=1 Tax=Mesorhizobium sp. M6A.T.Ce.TU.016.01.1.1 TaxID=2496783 RepID=UPI000FCA4ABC|nr:hypothetical protein [Mesorhizobium sp. M6A.T.Ce.TU.016.01.1.1]RUU28322.1 hypothetical protein EOC94_17830 [Mesorhizobium sp. M6A.T.Ce.TU.016.01.1.1]
MAGEHIKAMKEAIDSLRHAECDALQKITAENNPNTRAQFREIHDTLKTMRTALKAETSLIARLLKLIAFFRGESRVHRSRRRQPDRMESCPVRALLLLRTVHSDLPVHCAESRSKLG